MTQLKLLQLAAQAYPDGLPFDPETGEVDHDSTADTLALFVARELAASYDELGPDADDVLYLIKASHLMATALNDLHQVWSRLHRELEQQLTPTPQPPGKEV